MQCTGHHYSTTTWEPVNLYNPDQKFLDIAVTTNGILHAIDLRNGFLYKMDPVNLASNQHKMRLAPIARQIPLRSLACKEGTKMYAVGKEGLAVKLQTARLVGRDHWTVLGDQDYKLKKIAVGKQDGIKKKQIWGINMDDVAVLFDKKNKTWLDTKAQASGLDVTSDNDCIITRREDGCCMRWNGKSFQEVKNQEARGLASVSSFKKKCVLFGVEKESGKAVLLSVTKETK
ncbi:hypothetical protein AKO1_005963 [Acrasis kona]|uniref:Uncharacterized protein n=1 Tax=Acrasis kona TaxID=1008807 RepID=A0AAW2ZLI9_9EUKA